MRLKALSGEIQCCFDLFASKAIIQLNDFVDGKSIL